MMERPVCEASQPDQAAVEAILRAAQLLKIAAFEASRSGDCILAESCVTIVLEVEDLASLALTGLGPRPGAA